MPVFVSISPNSPSAKRFEANTTWERLPDATPAQEGEKVYMLKPRFENFLGQEATGQIPNNWPTTTPER